MAQFRTRPSISFTTSEKLKDKIIQSAEDLGLSISGFITMAISSYFNQQEANKNLGDMLQQMPRIYDAIDDMKNLQNKD